MQITHLAFSDESQHNTGRFRGIGMLSLPAEHAARISAEIRHQLETSNVTEVKWKKVRGARDRFAALKVLALCVEEAWQGHLRVDVLIWDTQDQRHKLPGRDDNANLRNMYIQLFKNVMRNRWPMESVWQLFPDENSALDWKYIKGTLRNTDRFAEKEKTLFGNDWINLRTHFNLVDIAEVSSHEAPLAQAADLFAGMGVFSYEYHDTYSAWERQNSLQMELLPSEPLVFTSKEEEHARVLNEFLRESRRRGFNILNTSGLHTPNPTCAINFWLYRPQRKDDKAPLRGKKGNYRL